MSNVSDIYDKSELALAAYANLQCGVETRLQLSKLQDAGMTEAQAVEFTKRWPEVVGTVNDDGVLLNGTGLSATVFRNGAEVCIAIRGTEASWIPDLDDISADILLGAGAIPTQYEKLLSFYNDMLATYKITATDNVTIAGHSLGGFLSQLLMADNLGGFDEAYTYNAPGIGGLSQQALERIFESVPSSVPYTDMHNIQGDGKSRIASLGTMWGEKTEVNIENGTFAAQDHTIKKLTDSLAAYDTLWQLDNSLEISSFNDIFKQSSSSEEASLEGIVDALQKLFGISNSPLEIDNRDTLYEAIYTLKESDSYTALINNASVQSSATITASQAAIDFGAFLSLYQLSPIFISGAALQEPNQNLYGRWSAGEFSPQYIEDRIALLSAKLGANVTDTDYDDIQNGTYFVDSTNSLVIGETSDGIFAKDNKQIIFGSENSDSISGGDNADHLYGGDGADNLNSGAGDDFLEGGTGADLLNAGLGFDRINGGAGADLYQFEANQFGDAIISGDTDGGTISLLNGVSFRRVGSGEANTNGLYIAVDENGDWLSGKEGWSVSVAGSTATVSVRDAENNAQVIAIENFDINSNRFGIQFEKMPAVKMPAQNGAFTAPDDARLGQYTPSGGDTPVDIYLPNIRNVPNIAEAAAVSTQFDWEQYRNKSLAYNAADYWGEWNAGDLHWESEEDHPNGYTYPERPDEVLVVETRDSAYMAAESVLKAPIKTMCCMARIGRRKCRRLKTGMMPTRMFFI